MMSCNFCEKRGLALLPVRAAVVPTEAAAPALPSSVTLPVKAGTHAQYTCRQLREGYLYVYDEKRSSWTDYIVTQEGYFWRIASKNPAAPGDNSTPCMGKTDEVARSTFIALPVSPDMSKNGVFWFGWADHPWTDSLRTQHGSASIREKHMQRFDLGAWLKSNAAPQAVPFEQLQTAVAEFAAKPPVAEQMQFLSAAWKPKDALMSAALQSEAKKVTEKQNIPGKHSAVILAVPDPVGITRDLAEILSRASDRFFAECRQKGASKAIAEFSEFDRKMALNGMIAQMEQNVRLNAQLTRTRQAKDAALRYRIGDLSGGSNPAYIPQDVREKMAQAVDDAATAGLQDIADTEWASYQAYYKESERQAFTSRLQAESDSYNKDYTQDISGMYLAWFGSTMLKQFFQYCFDPQDLPAGISYTSNVVTCILGGAQEAAAYGQYSLLLDGELTDKENVILRALVLNQDKIAQTISEKVSGALTASALAGVPWWAIFAATGTYLSGKSEKQAKDVLTSLHTVMAGTIGKKLSGTLTQDAIVGRLPVLLGYPQSNPVILVETTGSRLKLSTALATKIVEETFDFSGMSPAKRLQEKGRRVNQMKAQVNTSGMTDIIENEMRLKKAAGIQLEGKGAFVYLMMLSDDVSDELKGLNAEQRIAWWGTKMTGISRSGGVMIDPYLRRGMLKKAAGSSVVSLVLQGVAIKAMIKEEAHWYGGVKTDASRRVTATWTGLFGGVMESSMGLARLLGLVGKKYFPSLVAGTIELGGKLLGTAASFYLAWCDFKEFRKQADEDHAGLATLYFISAVAGVAFAIAMLVGASGWGIFLVPVIIGVSLLIAYFSPDDLQKWLEKTLWGTSTGDKYPAKDEFPQYEKLWAGQNDK